MRALLLARPPSTSLPSAYAENQAGGLPDILEITAEMAHHPVQHTRFCV